MLLYRVFPWVENARLGERGHPLHVRSPQGAGRADNPEHYLAAYLSSAPSGAVAEAFGGLEAWDPEMFIRSDLSASRRALGVYALSADAPICDLDDVTSLSRLGLRPSDVVTRRREVTQRWALAIYREQGWIGVRWWSYYDSRWHSYALWDRSAVSVERVEPLAIDHPAVIEAADVLRRPRATDRKR